MKEKLMALTQKLTKAGFNIEGIEVETKDLVRFKFADFPELRLIVNNSAAKIERGNCPEKLFSKLKEILKADFELKDKLEAPEKDMFQKLMDAA